MKNLIFRGAALMLALCASASAAALSCSAADDDIVLPVETEENEAFVSGDYTYSLLVDPDDDSWQAVCIESYTGTETDLVIPEEIDGMEVLGLGDRAFTSNYALLTVTLPSTLQLLGTYSFADCTRMMAYYVEEGNPVFESRDGVLYAEDGTSLVRYPVGTLPEEVSIPNGVVSIGNAAFTGCPSLARVNFPTTLQYIGKSAFSDCNALTELALPGGLTEIGEFAFNNCSNLKQVTLPATLQVIGGAAFAATAIESIDLPAGLVSVGQQAFAATEMKEVTIPSSVTDIGYDAFGWKADVYHELYMDDEFVIYGAAGSAAERYASDSEWGNDFKFEAVELEETPVSSDEEEETPDTKPSGTMRVVGIVTCCVLIAAVIVVAVVSGKKKPAEETQQADEPKNDDTSEQENESEEEPNDET